MSFVGGEVFDLSDIDITIKGFVIVESQFTLERRNGKELRIRFLENESNSERVLFIGLQAGNYFDGITVTQASN